MEQVIVKVENMNEADNQQQEDRQSLDLVRNKVFGNPLIVEKIISFLDGGSIKAARLVNPLWSIEGAKILFTKCYVEIPSNLDDGESSRENNTMEKFKAFLSHKSKENSMIPNIIINVASDLKLWKSLGVLGHQVHSLKLNSFDRNPKFLHNLFELLPNLNYLDCAYINCRRYNSNNIYNTMDSTTNVITAVMSKPEKDGNPLTLSHVTLDPFNEHELEDLEKFSDCINIMIEELEFYIPPMDLNRISHAESRIANILNKLLFSSQSVLKKLSLFGCEKFLCLLDFPYLTALVDLDLHFYSKAPSTLNQHYGFSSFFRFSDNVPNLQGIGIYYEDRQTPGPEFFVNLFAKAGTAPSVKRLTYSDSSFGCMIDHLFHVFPNVEDFKEVCIFGCSQKLLTALWRFGTNLKHVSFSIDWEFLDGLELKELVDLDTVITGFSPDIVERLKKRPKLIPCTSLDTMEILDILRVNPSILNLKELKVLRINFIGYSRRKVPHRVLAVAGEYALKLLPSNAEIFIDVGNCRPGAEGVLTALDEVSELPNVRII